jgi:hypothetical protein
VHHFANLDTHDARGLSVTAPGRLGPQYFREIAEVVNAGGPPNVQRIMDVMRRHGLRPAPPVRQSTLQARVKATRRLTRTCRADGLGFSKVPVLSQLPMAASGT